MLYLECSNDIPQSKIIETPYGKDEVILRGPGEINITRYEINLKENTAIFIAQNSLHNSPKVSHYSSDQVKITNREIVLDTGVGLIEIIDRTTGIRKLWNSRRNRELYGHATCKKVGPIKTLF